MPFWLKEPNCIKTEAYNVSHMIIGSTNNPLIDIFLYSHDLYGLYCIVFRKEKLCLADKWELQG